MWCITSFTKSVLCVCVFLCTDVFVSKWYQQAHFFHRFYFPNATFFVVVVYRFSFPVLLSRSPCRCFRSPCSGYQVSFHRAFFTNVFVLTVIKTYVEKEKPSNAESVVWGRGAYTYRYVDFWYLFVLIHVCLFYLRLHRDVGWLCFIFYVYVHFHRRLTGSLPPVQ